MFHRSVSPHDGPAACSLLLDTTRALTGGAAACLVAAPSNARALARALGAVEGAAGDLQARWTPSFLVVGANQVQWDAPWDQLAAQSSVSRAFAEALRHLPSSASDLPAPVRRAVRTARCVHCVLRDVFNRMASPGGGPAPHSRELAIRAPCPKPV
eukprot:m51a1_g12874 hypothetical protein (156) ;mRNA; r:4765-5232